MIGAALRLRLELDALRERHRTPAPEPVRLDPLPPTDDAVVVMSGVCSTATPDHDRIAFAPRALTWSTLPPLRYRHGEQNVGRVLQLVHAHDGLRCLALVDDPVAATAPAFSVCGTVRDYKICNAGTPDYFALITSATLAEVSLVLQPANRECLIFDRMPAADATARMLTRALCGINIMHELIADRMEVLA